jgi:hypothetical protein
MTGMATAPFEVSDYPVAHGYTLADLDQLTRGALKADRLVALDYADRRDIACSAIAEHLCAAEEAPSRIELIQVGWQAIARTVRDGYRARGYQDGDYGLDGAPSMPRFMRFWGSGVTSSHEDGVVERVAVGQVLRTLPDIYRDAIVALAVGDDYMRAAELLGISYKALVARIGVARRSLLELWHEGETPHRTKRVDRRVEVHGQELATQCGNGHDWTPENTRIRHRMVRGKPKRGRVCQACERARSRRRAGAA